MLFESLLKLPIVLKDPRIDLVVISAGQVYIAFSLNVSAQHHSTERQMILRNQYVIEDRRVGLYQMCVTKNTCILVTICAAQ